MTPGMHFFDARLKIGRADQHIREATALVDGLPDSYKPTVTVHEYDGPLLTHELPDPEGTKQTLGLIAGDAMHNLRSALDYAWIGALAKLEITPSNRSKFPVVGTLNDLENLLGKENVPTDSGLHDCMLHKIKAYEDGNEFLWALHKLNNSDKHKLVLPIEFYASINNFEVRRIATGEVIKGGSWGMKTEGKFEFPFHKSEEVHDPGKMGISVMIGEGMPLKSMDVHECLQVFSHVVVLIVNQLEAI